MSYLDDSLAHLEIFEGTVPWMYLDTRGFVTVGVGELLASSGKAETLAFVDPDGEPSAEDTILDEFNRVAELIPAKVAAFYRSPTSPVLPHAAIDTLLMNHLNFFDAQLASRFRNYVAFPDPAKLGLLDMIYNLGQVGLFQHFPHFMAAVDKQDWLGAAANCHRVGPSQARNDWTRQQFLAAAAAATSASGSGPASASTIAAG